MSERPRWAWWADVTMGAVAFLIFTPLSQAFWAGDARSLIMPQLLVLGPAVVIASEVARRSGQSRWHGLVVIPVFYVWWGLTFLGIAPFSRQH